MEISIENLCDDKPWDSTPRSKIHILGLNLHQASAVYQDVVQELDKLKQESENYKSLYLSQIEQCERKSCKGSVDLKKTIAMKEHIINLVAATLTTLEETRNFNILREVFKILCGEIATSTPPKDNNDVGFKIADLKSEPSYMKSSFLTPKTQKNTSMSDVSLAEESVSEIEGTPTGRISPIILSRKTKSRSTTEITEERVKKKSCENWPNSDKKFIKLSIPVSKSSPSKASKLQGQGRLKQSRLHLVRPRPKLLVDLTSSPDLAGFRASPSDGGDKVDISTIKKESLENDDTILPSPTSNPLLSKYSIKSNSIKSSPRKMKVSPEVEAEIKREPLSSTFTEPDGGTEVACHSKLELKVGEGAHMEESINLLNPFRFPKSPKKKAKVKQVEVDENARQDAGDAAGGSLSMLQHVNQLEKDHKNNNIKPNCSSQRPLAENINLTNIQSEPDTEINVSSSQPALQDNGSQILNGHVKRKTPEKVEPIFKEPTVRKKAEKIKLPGWSCEECRLFYDELYKDQPEILAKLMHECSKHRGRRNPARPSTPPGYWYPRWDVPDDTEAFNKRNNIN